MGLKTFKPVHWIYNILHYSQLKHNEKPYRQYHIKRSLIASISSKDFPDKESRAWLDQGDSAQLAPERSGYLNFPKVIQNNLLNWSKDGYMVLDQFFDKSTCDAINAEIERLQQCGKLKFTNGNKLMFAMKMSKLIKGVANDERIRSILRFILDREIIPFQTINFITGSGQRAHSDSIHMTTYPLGYLIAVWIALEDITHNNGPLFYYPGSHKLPYVLNNDFKSGETMVTLGNGSYTDYEDVIEEMISKKGLKRVEFHAKKGDVFIWHANLVHGGAPILDKDLTRKSMVIHYYAKDVIKYHEITERPSLLNE